ncbi:MAG: DNA internalization-related competence protein ComEC/Rec2 [Bacteroidota bacterium]|nr:DNA internalization-related competence protein ComEC/Rec2 [Bacteroidota bacterium]
MWNNKPAAAAAFFIIGGIYSAHLIAIPWYDWGSGAFFFLAASLIVLFRFRKTSGRSPLHSFAFPALLVCSSATAYVAGSSLSERNSIKNFLDFDEPLHVVCEIADEPKVKDGKTSVIVHVRSIAAQQESLQTTGDALVTIVPNRGTNEAPSELHYGWTIGFTGILEAPTSARNPGEFSYRDYLALNDIFATAHVAGYSNITIIQEKTTNRFFEYVIFPTKHFVVRVVRSVISGDEANFLLGLLLGDRSGISSDIKNAFINTGTIHVLAVSGLHVGLVVAVFYTLLGLLRFPSTLKNITTIIGLFFYMELTGAAPSVVRASLMVIVVLLSRLFQYRTNVYNALGVSAVILLLLDPRQLFNVGFQLSFAAVFSIVYFYPKLALLIKQIPEKWEEIKGVDAVLKLFAVSLSAQIGTLPFTAYYFGRVSVVSLVANIVVVPLIGVIVTIGFVSVLAGIVSMWLSTFFSETNNILLWFTLKFVAAASAVPHATISTAMFGLKETFFYSTAVTFLFNLRNKTIVRRTAAVTFAVIDLLLFVSLFDAGEQARLLRITYLDVGQGDAALIDFPTGEHVLVDAGPKTFSYDAGEKVIVPFLKRHSVSQLSAIVITHPHDDHMGGAPFVMRSLPVEEVIDAGQRAQSNIYYDYENLEKILPHDEVRAGMKLIRIPNARLYVLDPVLRFLDQDSTDGFSDLNNTSVVFKLQYGATSFLFAGDAEARVERHLDSVYGDFLKSDVLKAGHHGSSTSSTEEFLSNVHPKQVVVSVGKFNKFHHPSRKVIERFEHMGADVHRTDEEGAVIFESDGFSVRQIKWKK